MLTGLRLERGAPGPRPQCSRAPGSLTLPGQPGEAHTSQSSRPCPWTQAAWPAAASGARRGLGLERCQEETGAGQPRPSLVGCSQDAAL